MSQIIINYNYLLVQVINSDNDSTREPIAKKNLSNDSDGAIDVDNNDNLNTDNEKTAQQEVNILFQ